MKTPNYITALLQSTNGKNAPSRRVWSIDLEAVWLPFFTATNVMGETSIPSEELGAPLRLAYAKDGAVKFTQSGRPSMKVASGLNGHIRMVRENFVAGLQAYAGTVAHEEKKAYIRQVEAAQEAARPVHAAQEEAITEALRRKAGEAQRQAECVAQEAEAQAAVAQEAEKEAEKEPVAV